MSSRLRWAMFGAAFGCCFPLIALGIRWVQDGAAGAMAAFSADPLLWIILSAPAFLGGFAALGGHQQDALRALALALEDRVAERTRELSALTERMTRVLDSMSDALITIQLDGILDAPPQAQSYQWFGEAWQGKSLACYVAPGINRFRVDLALGLEQIRDDILPLELTLSQLPAWLETEDGRSLGLEYVPLNVAADERRLLVVLSDVTSEVAAEKMRAEQAEQQTLVAHLLRDPSGFRMFRVEIEALLEQARATSDSSLCRRLVHTIKGSSAVYGLTRIAAACQRLEDSWSEAEQAALSPQVYVELRGLLDGAMALVAPFLSQDDSTMVRLARQDIICLLEDVRRDAPQDAVVRTLRDWSMEPVRPILERLGGHAEQIGVRLGKQVRIVIDDQRVRLDLATYARFFQSLVHLVRNSVDHGLESADERRIAGKGPMGQLRLSSKYEGEFVRLEVSDDGRGIDWPTIGERAHERGLPFVTEQERLDALLTDGLSSVRQISDLSGRGVGLGAVKGACDELGIQFSLSSQAGMGTTVTFLLSRIRRSMCPPAGPMSVRRRTVRPGSSLP